ncbi:MAG: CHASE2 domain-containing protein [Chthoniobacter sp.]|nr:CHASE2 domain-containing protein [Chthoniobacter sp.]
MLRRQSASLFFATAVLTAASAALCHWPSSPLAAGERAAQDFLMKNGRRTPPNPKLFFLAIDNASIALDATSDLKGLFGIEDETGVEARGLKMMSQSWPWSRGVYGLILDRLIGAGAKAVAFDLTFPTAGEQDDDFRAALERHADHVVIGSNFIDSARPNGAGFDVSLTPPTPALIPPRAAPDPRVGFVNFWPDRDGVVRQAQFRTNLADILGTAAIQGDPDTLSLAAHAVAKAGQPGVIPAGRASQTFRFTAGPLEGFPPRSVFEIFVPEYWARNYQSGAVFRDAIVVVGAAGNWQHDEHATPLGKMPGPELQLNAINALLHQEFLLPVPWPFAALVWIATGAIAFGSAIFIRSPLRRVALLLAVAAGWVACEFLLFNRLGRIAPFAGPLVVLGLCGLLHNVFDLLLSWGEQKRLKRDLAERERIEAALQAANDELEGRVRDRTRELTESNTKLVGLVQEKDVLLKEIHHRVKNNLQIISSLLNLQSDYIKDPAALLVFTESRNRVRSMALIHEKLYQSHDLARIDFADYIRSLTSSLTAGYAGRSSSGRSGVESEDVMLGVDAAVPCGLIVNELVTNCLKYAFPNGRSGQIQIAVLRDAGKLRLSVADDGVGFPHDIDFRNSESLGMQIITTLTEQLDGSVQMFNGTGTKFEITFPESH